MLSKTPVLDKGHVAVMSASLRGNDFTKMQRECFGGTIDDRLLDIVQVHLDIKCPLFVQLSFAEHGLTTSSKQSGQIEAYVPGVNEINARDLESNEKIQQTIEQTTEALILNPQAFRMDGCDKFVSQVVSPISVYNHLMVSGSLSQVVEYVSRTDLPSPIEQFRKAIEHVIVAEWNPIREVIDSAKETRKQKR